MAIEFKILGWSAEGLRCPDHKVSFEKKDRSIHKITLIQMPNGTGKTTTLKLLRAALAGPEIWTESFDKPIQFRKDKTSKKGKFVLYLLHGASKRLTIELNFNFTGEGECSYTTIRQQGNDRGFDPPPALKAILKPDFVKLLVFDGELAATLLDSHQTNAQSAIEEIYQLSYLSRMRDRFDEYWNSVSQENASSGSAKEFNRRRNKVATLEDRIKDVKRQKKKDEARLESILQHLTQLEEEFKLEMQKHKTDNEMLVDAEAALQQAVQIVTDKTRQAVLLMKNPAELSSAFSDAILALKNSLDRAKLPGIAAREFFVEISEQPHCICGRAIDKDTKKFIQQGAQKYLGSDEVAVLNAMKTDIKERIPLNGREKPGEQLKKMIKAIERAKEAEIMARQDLDAVKETVNDHDPEIKSLSEKIKLLTEEKGGLVQEMEKYEDSSDDSDEGWNLSILKKKLKDANDDLAVATNTVELKDKKDILCRIMDSAFSRAQKSLNDTVCQEVNSKLKELMPNNNIQVASIDKSLRLAEKEGGSMGETLAVGYAFLSSLLSNASHTLPLVVDSPSGAIDLLVRPEIARLIPKLGQQFIAFTISSEREGFVKPLLKAAPKEVEFLTLFRKGNKDLEKAARATKQVEETVDGLLVTGQAYFENFHSDKEE